MRPVHFEIPAGDPGKLADFYATVFDWKISKWDGPMDYWLVGTGEGPGIDGAIMTRDGPATGTVNTIDVPDIDAAIEKVAAAGGEAVTEKHAVPGVGWHAYLRDPEGNLFGVMQADEGAGA